MFKVSGAAAEQLLSAAARRKPSQVCLKGGDTPHTASGGRSEACDSTALR